LIKTALKSTLTTLLLIAQGLLLADESSINLNNQIKVICENKEYTKCIKLTKTQCTMAMDKAIKSCPLKKLGDTDIKYASPACVIDMFLKEAKIPDDLAVLCDKVFKDEVNFKPEQF
jgi:hypothetical protein